MSKIALIGARAERRLALASATKAVVKNIRKFLVEDITKRSAIQRSRLHNLWVKQFGKANDFSYSEPEDVVDSMMAIDIDQLVDFLVKNNILAKNSPVLRGYNFNEELSFLSKQPLNKNQEINDQILGIVSSANPTITKHKALITDWLIDNGFEFEVVGDKLDVPKADKRKLDKFIADLARDFSIRAPNAPYTTYYPATEKDYTDALKILGFNPENLDVHSVKIGRALQKLAVNKVTVFEKLDVDEASLVLAFKRFRVPVTITKSDDGFEVSAVGVFPQTRELINVLTEALARVDDIKILFPSTPVADNEDLQAFIDLLDPANIQAANIPVKTWTTCYSDFVKVLNNQATEDATEKDTVLFNSCKEALRLNKDIEGLGDNYKYQLMNDGVVVLTNEPQLASGIADALNNAGIKAKVKDSRFGSIVEFDSKQAYAYFNQ